MSDAYRLYQQGLEAIAADHADEAIAPLERAKALEPGSGSIREALGKTYLQLGFFDRAIEEFTVIIDNDPTDAYAQFCLGRAHDRAGDAPAARHHYRLATLLDPERRIYTDTLNVFLSRTAARPEDNSTQPPDSGGPFIFGD
ncbi:MAG: tetratricopeptide repeat protein [Gaiellales bacterium]